MEERKGRATIYEVAKKANVSLATVSRVINGKGNVNEETAKLVRDAIDELGYIPSGVAQGLATSTTTNIGIFLPSPNYVYINKILSGMMDVCKIYGYRPLLFTYEDVSDAERAIDSVIASRVEGIVVYNSQLEEEDVEKFAKISLPTVIIGSDKLMDTNGLVDADYRSSLAKFVKAEIQNGIKEIVFLKDPNKDWHVTNGYEDTLIEETKDKNVTLKEVEINDSYTSIYEHYIEEFKKHKPNHELFITTRDSLGHAILNAGQDLGYNCPDDFEVMGVIGTKDSVKSRPQLSSIKADLYEVGSIAMRMLTKMLKDEMKQKEFIFTSEYVKRGSTKI